MKLRKLNCCSLIFAMLFLLVSGCVTSSNQKQDTIVVVHWDAESFAGKTETYQLIRNGEFYIWDHESSLQGSYGGFENEPFSDPKSESSHRQNILSVSELEGIIRRLQESPRTPEDLLKSYGITASTLVAQHQQIDDLIAEPIEVIKWDGKNAENVYLDDEDILQVLFLWLSGESGFWFPDIGFSLLLPGDPQIRVSSGGGHPGMLPLLVETDNETWEVYNPEISLQLRKCLFRSVWCRAALDIDNFWREKVWEDNEYAHWSQVFHYLLVSKAQSNQQAP